MTDPGSGLDARDDFLWVVHHWTNLRAHLRPGGGNALTGIPGGPADHPIPIDLHTSSLIYEITETARFYGRVLLNETNPEHGCNGRCHGSPSHRCTPWATHAATVVPADDCPLRVDAITTSAMPGLLEQVARRYGHFTAGTDEQLAYAFRDDASGYRARVRHALTRPAPPTYLGPCQADNCHGEVHVREGRDTGTCPECGREVTVAEQREWLEGQMETRLMTASELVSALTTLDLATPFGTIRSWIGRGRLVEAVPGAGLYRLRDAKDLAARRRVA